MRQPRKRSVRLALAVLAILGVAVLAACSTAARSSDAGRASAAAHGTTAQTSESTASKLVTKCLGGTPTEASLVKLALNKPELEAAAACLEIPKANRKAFATAAFNSATAWYEAKGFKTKAGRDAWFIGDITLLTASGAKEPSLPQLVGEYGNG